MRMVKKEMNGIGIMAKERENQGEEASWTIVVADHSSSSTLN